MKTIILFIFALLLLIFCILSIYKSFFDIIEVMKKYKKLSFESQLAIDVYIGIFAIVIIIFISLNFSSNTDMANILIACGTVGLFLVALFTLIYQIIEKSHVNKKRKRTYIKKK